jgi:hypothetical protein
MKKIQQGEFNQLLNIAHNKKAPQEWGADTVL